jgi:hypothetical protein
MGTTLSFFTFYKKYIPSNGGMIENDECEMIWKEVAVAHFKVEGQRKTVIILR